MQSNAYQVISDGGIILLSGSFVSTNSCGLGKLLEYFPTAFPSLQAGISNAEQFSGLSYLREPAEDGIECKVFP